MRCYKHHNIRTSNTLRRIDDIWTSMGKKYYHYEYIDDNDSKICPLDESFKKNVESFIERKKRSWNFKFGQFHFCCHGCNLPLIRANTKRHLALPRKHNYMEDYDDEILGTFDAKIDLTSE